MSHLDAVNKMSPNQGYCLQSKKATGNQYSAKSNGTTKQKLEIPMSANGVERGDTVLFHSLSVEGYDT
jgi:hypothetical protein